MAAGGGAAAGADAEGGEGGDEGLGAGGGGAFGHSDAEFLKEGFGLILVDVHAGKVGW